MGSLTYLTLFKLNILLSVAVCSMLVMHHDRLDRIETHEGFKYPRTSFAKIFSELRAYENKKPDARVAEIKSVGSGIVIKVLEDYSIVISASHVCSPKHFDELIKKNKVEKFERSITVIDFFGIARESEVILENKVYDLCLIKVDGKWAPPVEIASNPAQQGSVVYNIAAPLGFAFTSMVPLFSGRYSGDVHYDDDDINSIYAIPTHRGSSGSAILNRHGKIVGIIHSSLQDFDHLAISCTLEELNDFMRVYRSLVLGSKNRITIE